MINKRTSNVDRSMGEHHPTHFMRGYDEATKLVGTTSGNIVRSEHEDSTGLFFDVQSNGD